MADIHQQFPDEDRLIQILFDGGFIQNDPERHGYHILNSKFISLLDQSEIVPDSSEQICVWLEYNDEIGIQVDANSQNIETVKIPGQEKIIGDLDFAYSIISELNEDIEADFTDPITGIKYKIRDLDFSNYVGYGKPYIHVDRYIKPTKEFIDQLEQIVKCKLKYCLFCC